MKKPFFAWQNFNDRTKAFDFTHGTFVVLTFFRNRYDSTNNLKSGFCVFTIGSCNNNNTNTIFFANLDVCIGFALNTLNHFTTGADNRSNEARIDRDLG